MKTKIIGALIGLFTCQMTWADIPQDYSLDCWDQTFMYNMLQVRSQSDKLVFVSSGQKMSIYKNLIGDTHRRAWGRLAVAAELPQKDCRISSKDAKVITCAADSLIVHISGELDGKTIDKKVQVGPASIQVRKVTEAAIDGKDLTGYELNLVGGSGEQIVLLSQSYFYGLGGDATKSCQLKKN